MNRPDERCTRIVARLRTSYGPGMKHALIFAPAFCIATLAEAHPHIFVEAQVEVVMDGSGAMTGVRLIWDYDDFFGFLLTTDLGIDPEGDLILTPEEAELLEAQVLAWPEDFAGDLSVAQYGQVLALGPREQATAELRNGRVRETHFRPLVVPADAATPISIQVYDPFYYVAYEIVGEIGLTGGDGCVAQYQKADLNAAYSLVDELLYGRPASDVGPDEEFPEVGVAFADTVIVSCNG